MKPVLTPAIFALAAAPLALISAAGSAADPVIYSALSDSTRNDRCQRGDGEACDWQARDALRKQFDIERLPENFNLPSQSQPKTEGRKAIVYLQKACSFGYRSACTTLGTELLEGRYVAYDQAGGVTLLAGSCRAGQKPACDTLYYAYTEGRFGIAKDAAKAALYAPAPASIRRNAKLAPRSQNRWFELGWEGPELNNALKGVSVQIDYTLTVGPDGRVSKCTHSGSDPAEKLFGNAACAQLTKRARFEPATDANGNPVAANWSGNVGWDGG
jgi:hypothetical protein